MGKPHSVVLDSDGVNDCLVYMLRDVEGYIKPLYMFLSFIYVYMHTWSLYTVKLDHNIERDSKVWEHFDSYAAQTLFSTVKSKHKGAFFRAKKNR